MGGEADRLQAPAFDIRAVRAAFPALHQQVHGKPLVYLDNAASTQKPRAVLETLAHYYGREYANVHRGVHHLSGRVTDAYEQARTEVAGFINAPSVREVVFLRGATEAINLVAQTWGRVNIRSGDEILVTGMEHHANIVPWQMLCEQTGAVLKVAPVADDGTLDLDTFGELLGDRTRLVAVTHVSNVLGTVNPVAEIAALARRHGARVLVDGAQAVPHLRVDVQAIDCDFYVFSGHKMYGPTGIGVLWGRADLLEAMPPWQGGGEMIRTVDFEQGTTYAGIPQKFEAGTPHFVGAIGLGAAIDYLETIGMDAIAAWERELCDYAMQAVAEVPGVRVIGTAPDKGAILSFVMDGAHPHDIGTILDMQGIAVRTGHHCAMPLARRFGVPATVRASLSFYNTPAEIDALIAALHKVHEVLK